MLLGSDKGGRLDHRIAGNHKLDSIINLGMPSSSSFTGRMKVIYPTSSIYKNRSQAHCISR